MGLHIFKFPHFSFLVLLQIFLVHKSDCELQALSDAEYDNVAGLLIDLLSEKYPSDSEAEKSSTLTQEIKDGDTFYYSKTDAKHPIFKVFAEDQGGLNVVVLSKGEDHYHWANTFSFVVLRQKQSNPHEYTLHHAHVSNVDSEIVEWSNVICRVIDGSEVILDFYGSERRIEDALDPKEPNCEWIGVSILLCSQTTMGQRAAKGVLNKPMKEENPKKVMNESMNEESRKEVSKQTTKSSFTKETTKKYIKALEKFDGSDNEKPVVKPRPSTKQPLIKPVKEISATTSKPVTESADKNSGEGHDVQDKGTPSTATKTYLVLKKGEKNRQFGSVVSKFGDSANEKPAITSKPSAKRHVLSAAKQTSVTNSNIIVEKHTTGHIRSSKVETTTLSLKELVGADYEEQGDHDGRRGDDKDEGQEEPVNPSEKSPQTEEPNSILTVTNPKGPENAATETYITVKEDEDARLMNGQFGNNRVVESKMDGAPVSNDNLVRKRQIPYEYPRLRHHIRS